MSSFIHQLMFIQTIESVQLKMKAMLPLDQDSTLFSLNGPIFFSPIRNLWWKCHTFILAALDKGRALTSLKLKYLKRQQFWLTLLMDATALVAISIRLGILLIIWQTTSSVNLVAPLTLSSKSWMIDGLLLSPKIVTTPSGPTSDTYNLTQDV